jgi:glycosyltransferase involved in cell wall biosynthesis
MKRVIVAMPVFNEESVIEEIVREYLAISFEISLIIVDDKSTDSTPEILSRLNGEFSDRVLHQRNKLNMGHGFSFTKALQSAIEKKPDLIISCDGDGPLSGEDLKSILIQFGDKPYLEVRRLNRKEPLFRKIVSLFTRVLVFLKTGQLPSDANTPIRLYSLNVLEEFLPKIYLSPVPNLLVSILSRLSTHEITKTSVTVQRRKGSDLGTMWGKSKLPTFLPNHRFLMFSYRSFLHVARTKF